MDISVLQERRKLLEAQFADVQAKSNQKRQEIQDLEDELKRLQGQYREIEILLKQMEQLGTPSVKESKAHGRQAAVK